MRAIRTIIGSYLIASVPVAYLTARLLSGIDLREHGSGNVGASNIWQSASKPAVVPVGLAEIGQGLLGPAVAIVSGLSPAAQAAAGVAAVAGHNWSPLLRFAGGRGVAHAIGVMLAISRQALAAFIVISLIGVRVRAIPQFVGLGVLSAPVVAKLTRQPAEIVAGLAAIAALIFAKRLMANEPPAPDAHRGRVLVNRLLYDRDTSDRDIWLARGAAQS
ncbi:MAG: glycerol-3-phosphate acyltransferase [Chloroflexi bacterium]|nr:glycerol-3-phosphate acyltransferase [Chloroflexota bacterium]